MHAIPRTITVAAASAAFLVLLAPAAHAQRQRPLFEWRGQVDREVDIVMRGNDLSTRPRGNERTRSRSRTQGAIPSAPGYVSVQMQRGRGRAEVVQQPSARNGYTAIVRVRDDRPGADAYQLHAYWQPAYADRDGSWGRGDDSRGGDGNWGRGPDDRGRDHDHDYDRGRGGRGQDDGGYRDGGYGSGGYGGGYGVGSGSLRWTGSVDDVVDIRIQGRRVDYTTVSGSPVSGVRSQLSGGALGAGARVSVRQNGGRGTVMVLQQPSAQNGYTALVRVIDRAAGAAYYDLDLTW